MGRRRGMAVATAVAVWAALVVVSAAGRLTAEVGRTSADAKASARPAVPRGAARPTGTLAAAQAAQPDADRKAEPTETQPKWDAASSRAGRLLLTAQRLLQRGDYVQAVRLLQSLLDQPEDTLLVPSDGPAAARATSVKQQAEALLGRLPDEAQAAYRLQFGRQAARELAQAVSSGDRRRLLDVARRYFHTSSGREAAYQLASSYLDHGQPLAAALWLQRLLQYEPPGPRRQLFRVKAVLAWLAAGEPGLAKALWREGSWSVPAEWTSLAAGLGRVESFDDLARRVRRLWPAARQTSGTSEWLTCRGDFARRCEAGPVNVTGPTVWTHSTLTDREPSHPWALSRSAGLQSLVVGHAASLRLQTPRAPRVPAVHPLVVGGCVVCRTVNTIQAFDLHSGRLLWQSALLDPTLAEIARQLNNQATQPQAMAERLLPAYLNQRWFLDTTTGTLSSDGQTVFAIEEAKLLGAQYLLAARTRPGRLYFDGSNRLVALDVRTGKIRWVVGGPRTDRRLPLVGVFFLAPPVVRGGSLYCLAYEGGDTRLLVLSAKDGQLQWSLTLDPAQQAAHPDLRWLYTGNGPSLYENVLVCPVPGGGCVAVDVDQQRPLWVYRYRKPPSYAPGNPQALMLQAIRQSQLSGNLAATQDRWLVSVPVVAHGRVLLTPSDSDQLHCLRLVDGQLLWRRPREQGLFVAAVTERNVVVVGRNQVVAWRLEDGEPAWPQRLNIPAPAGQGVRSGDLYHLPLATSEVLTFDLDDGRLLARSAVPNRPALGNLAAGEGVVVVQSFDSVSAFSSLEQRRRVLEEGGSELDAERLAERGELRLHLGDVAGGLQDVRRSLALKPNPRAARLLRARLFDDLRRDVKANWAAVRELESLVETPEQRTRLLRLKAEGLQRLGRVREAVQAYLALARDDKSGSSSPGLQVVRSDDGLLTTSTDCWVRVRLSRLYQQASRPQREQVDRWLQAELRRIPADDLVGLRQFVLVTERLPVGAVARRRLVEALAEQQPWSVDLEFQLWRLAEGNHAAAAAFARARLAELYLQTGHVEVAERLAGQLERQPQQLAVDSKTTVAEWLSRWRALPLVAARRREQPSWPRRRLVARQVSQVHAIEQVLKVPHRRPKDSLFDRWSFQWRRRSESLVAVDGLGRPRWRLPLPDLMLGAPYFGGLSVAHTGHLVLLSLGDRFLVLDALAGERAEGGRPFDSPPRVLWGRLLLETAPRRALGRFLRGEPVGRPGGGDRVVLLDPLGRAIGGVTLVGPDVVCYQVGRTLYAADLLTGETRWARQDVPRGAEIFGDSEQVVLVAPNTGELTFLRTDDGQLLKQRDYPLSAQRLSTVGRHVLSWRSDQAGAELVLQDLLSDQELWRRTFEPGSLVTLVGSDEVVVVERKGRAVVVSADTGQTVLEAKVPAVERASHLFAVRGRDRYLLFLTSLDRSTLTRVSGLPYLTDQVPLNGRIDALDRSTGRLRWSVPVDQTVVDIGQPPDLPVLVLACRRGSLSAVSNPNSMPVPTKPVYSLSVLDLRTGQFIFRDDKQPPMNGFLVRASDDGKSIEILTDRTTLKLSFSGDPLD